SVDKADFIVTRGTISWFRSSGPSRRGFCANCGTPLVYEQLTRANTNVALGSLDDPLGIRPAYQFGAESRIPFLCEILSIPATVSMDDPEEDGVKLAEVASTNRQHPDHDTDAWPVEKST
ncbi:MAG: GFA family protein, partial [Hoeflea sp.]